MPMLSMDPRDLRPPALSRPEPAAPANPLAGSPATPVADPAALPLYALPLQWNPKDKNSNLEVANNYLRVLYRGSGRSDSDSGTVRSNCPIPPQAGIYYFEVTIVSKGRDGYIGIGVCDARVNLARLPGWEDRSWAYHGDDGNLFSGSGSGRPYGPTFSTGDVMGCCINFMDMTISFTKNGILLGVAFRDFLARARDPVRLFPCVGLRTPGEIVEANFGQRPFKFDITQYCREERAKFRTAINASPLVYPFGTAANPSSATASAAAAVAGTSRRPPTEARIINSIVLAYMIHHGYSQTASAFHRAAFGGSGFDSSDQMAVVADLQDAPALIPDQFSGSKSIQDRQNIQRLIVDGDIDAAISEISRLYPALFKQHPVVRFQLDCLRFTGAVEASAAADSDAFDDDDDEFYDAMDVEDGHSGAGPPDSISGADGAELMDGAGARIGEDAPLRVGGHAANNNGLHLTAHAHGGLAGAAAPHSRAASSLGIVQLGQQLQRTYGDVPDERVRLALNETFALVCYPHPRSSPLAHLLGAPARKAVASVINDAILGLESLPQTPALETLVRQTFLTRDILVSEDVGAASFLDPERELLS